MNELLMNKNENGLDYKSYHFFFAKEIVISNLFLL